MKEWLLNNVITYSPLDPILSILVLEMVFLIPGTRGIYRDWSRIGKDRRMLYRSIMAGVVVTLLGAIYSVSKNGFLNTDFLKSPETRTIWK